MLKAQRLTGMNDVDANNNVINDYAYTYDAEGHILTETSSNEQTTTTLTYDANGRLTSEIGDAAFVWLCPGNGVFEEGLSRER